MPRVPDVEMRRVTIRVVELHNNTEETADLSYAGSFPTVSDVTGFILGGKLREFCQIPHSGANQKKLDS